jgi:hypothetical protein
MDYLRAIIAAQLQFGHRQTLGLAAFTNSKIKTNMSVHMFETAISNIPKLRNLAFSTASLGECLPFRTLR